MWNEITDLLRAAYSETPPFPPTVLYNENWMLWLTLDWLARHSGVSSPIVMTDEAEWFAEARLPSAFLALRRGDPLAESHTHADAVVGHIRVGARGRADVALRPGARQFSVIEGKMRSPLSRGVSNARDFDQAARNVACIAEVLNQAKVNAEDLAILSFHVIAPQAQINAGVFGQLVTKDSIRRKVEMRVAMYEGKRDAWLRQWFEPTLDRISIGLMSWESLIAEMVAYDDQSGARLREFYHRCLEHNPPRPGLPAKGLGAHAR